MWSGRRFSSQPHQASQELRARTTSAGEEIMSTLSRRWAFFLELSWRYQCETYVRTVTGFSTVAEVYQHWSHNDEHNVLNERSGFQSIISFYTLKLAI